MAQTQTVKLTNRSPKKPIKKLPESIQYPADATVEEVKALIAAACGIKDYNRIGLFDPTTNKTFKNRKAVLAEEPSIIAGNDILVKDLGPQIQWRTVYVIEYFGPLLFHALVVAARPYLYNKGVDFPLSTTQWITFAMIMLHFLKREIETLFVHKFSANTMPVFNVFKNSAFYWLVSGLICALSIYRPNSMAATADEILVDYVGLVVYLFGELSNASVHLYLASLRSTGGTERKIPLGFSFTLVTCPNYMFELISWAGIIIVSREWTVVAFIVMGAYQMYAWALGKEKAYRREFGDLYKKKRYVMVPGII
ncbi:unnamed protein product [Clonostachys rosea]|uniref:3-oxo-5-alpha-steroid 4-dehydrogenase C-terminal domain-containing protein n=1 Tax=Bionectria ochroleuca TaxID=29856 RepID=A0ABY6TYX9_BIOOC|nr:unnamed protein product [Clonostachys rosea]